MYGKPCEGKEVCQECGCTVDHIKCLHKRQELAFQEDDIPEMRRIAGEIRILKAKQVKEAEEGNKDLQLTI